METKCTQLALKEIRNERGILGWNKCVAHALNEWSADLRLQLPSTLASYGPITSLVQIGKASFKLCWEKYCFQEINKSTPKYQFYFLQVLK